MKKGDKVKYMRNEYFPLKKMSIRRGKIIAIWYDRILVERKDGERDWVLKDDILK